MANKNTFIGALIGAGLLLLAAVLNPSWVDWIHSMIFKPPPCALRPTGGAVSYGPVSGLTAQINGMAPPVTLKAPSIPAVTIANTTSTSITVNSVTLYESVDNGFRAEADIPPDCHYMKITSDDCVAASGPGTIASNGSCTITVSVPRPQAGFLLLDTSAGTMTVPIVAAP